MDEGVQHSQIPLTWSPWDTLPGQFLPGGVDQLNLTAREAHQQGNDLHKTWYIKLVCSRSHLWFLAAQTARGSEVVACGTSSLVHPAPYTTPQNGTGNYNEPLVNWFGEVRGLPDAAVRVDEEFPAVVKGNPLPG